jgi:hypothetical protein
MGGRGSTGSIQSLPSPKESTMNLTKIALVVALGGMSTACGGDFETGEGGEAELAELEEAIGQTECRNAAPTVSRTGLILPGFVSPVTYDDPGCTKAKVIQLNDYGTDGGGGVRVSYAGQAPGLPASCAAAAVRAIRYRRVSGNWLVSYDQSANGTWSSATNTCTVPSLFIGGFVPGDDYKFAITARNAANSTREVSAVSIVIR